MPDPVPLPTPPPMPGPLENGSEGDASGKLAMNRLPVASLFASSSSCCSRGMTLPEGCISARLTTGTVSRSSPVARARDGGRGCRFPPPPPPPPGRGCGTNTSLTCGESVVGFTVGRALDRDDAVSETTIDTAARCTAIAATLPLPAERNRDGSRLDGNARHRSERSLETSTGSLAPYVVEPSGGRIGGYSIRPRPLPVERTKTPGCRGQPKAR
jgi:hypothetical protein